MRPRPTVEDIRSYLRHSGWRREPRTWHDASIWANADGYEILVPPSDDLVDADLRVREILSVLTAVERRPGDEIAHDIGAPFADTQSFRTFPDGLPTGFTSLPVGLRGLQGVRDLVCAAARNVVEGPLPAYPGGTPPAVAGLLHRVQLGPSRPGSYVLTVRVPLNGPPDGSPDGSPAGRGAQPAAAPLGRQVTRRLYDAVAAVRMASARATEDDLTPFDETVAAGVSANLCEAMSGLAGRERRQPFEIAFRWGRGVASDVPAGILRFSTGTGVVISAAATRLRRLGASGDAAVTGVVESLHDQAQSKDRWRVKVRGDLTTRTGQAGGATVRTVWVRLGGQEPYDQAISAHKTKQRVRAQGVLAALKGRIELIVSDGGFDILD